MANKPINLRMKGKSSTGRQAMWEAMRARKDGFTYREVADSFCDLQGKTFRTYLQGLVKAGFVEMSDKARYEAATFKLIKDVGVNAPKINRNGEFVEQGSGTEQMWRAMRMLKNFSYIDLVAAASTEECPVSFNTAKTYAIALCKAGYLRRKSKGQYQFLMACFSGPKAPMIQRLKTVFDPNTQKIVWQQEVADD